MHKLYLSAQVIFEQGLNMLMLETFSNLYKKDLIEVGGIHAHCQLCEIDTSLYLAAILKWGLKRWEREETADPILKEVMMFMSIVRVEVANKVANINKWVNRIEQKVDQSILEGREKEVRVNTNINKLDTKLRELDHHLEILEEAWRGNQERIVESSQQ